MKKIIFVIVLFCVFSTCAKAESFYAGEEVKEVPIYLDKISKKNYRYFKTAYRRSDNVLVYCVEPEKLLSVQDEYLPIINNQKEYLDVSDEVWRRIELLSYFGYGYENHTDNKWAAITQYMIWQTVLPKGWFLSFTDGYGGALKNIHKLETDEIERLINDFETLPSFSGNNYKITKNNKLVLIDENNKLKHYKLISNPGIDVKINDNILEINSDKNGEYILNFVRGEYIPTKLYISNNNQAVISTDGVPSNNFSIKIIVESGDLTIKRLHDHYLDNDATNENATYEIIDNENNKRILNTNNSGEIFLKDLPLGEVTIKEIKPSEGYEIDTNEYKMEISNDNNTVLEVKPKLIIKKVNIIKKYLNEKNNVLPNEVNSIFSVTTNKNIKLTGITDEEGLVVFNIPYGEYTIIQNSSLVGYELMKDYNIFVKNSNELNLTFINYKKEVEKEEPETKEELVSPKEELEENIIEEPVFEDDYINIENPKTGDNISICSLLLIFSGGILSLILRKMQ